MIFLENSLFLPLIKFKYFVATILKYSTLVKKQKKASKTTTFNCKKVQLNYIT